MTVADRALAWLKSQWIEPDVSVFLHKAIASMACGGCGAVVTEPAWCPACAKVIEESEAESPCVSASGDSVDVPIGVTSHPSPDFPPAAVERRDEFEKVLADATAAMRAIGTGKLAEGTIVREGARAFSGQRHVTIELPDGSVVDVSKLDGEK